MSEEAIKYLMGCRKVLSDMCAKCLYWLVDDSDGTIMAECGCTDKSMPYCSPPLFRKFKVGVPTCRIIKMCPDCEYSQNKNCTICNGKGIVVISTIVPKI